MNNLPRDKQIEVIAALTEGLGVRAVSRVTGVNRGTVAALALRLGRGCAELHDRMMVGLRVGRIELDELWAFVGKKQKQVTRKDASVKGDQYTFIALASYRPRRSSPIALASAMATRRTYSFKPYGSGCLAHRRYRAIAGCLINPQSAMPLATVLH